MMVFLFVCFLTALPGFASSPDATAQLVHYLTQEKVSLMAEIQELETKSLPENFQSYQLQNQQNDASLALIKAQKVSLQNFLNNQQKQKQLLSQQLKRLQQSPLGKPESTLTQKQLIDLSASIDLHAKAIEFINDNLALADRYEQKALIRRHQLDLWRAKYEERAQLKQLNNRINLLNETSSKLLEKNLELQQKTHDAQHFSQQLNDQAQQLLNNQIITLIQHRINELELRKKIIKANYEFLKKQDVKSIQLVIDTYQSAIDQLSPMTEGLEKILVLLQDKQLILKDNRLKKQYSELKRTIAGRLQEISQQQQALQKALEIKQQQLKKQVSMRQTLSEYRLDTWPVLMKQLTQIPTQSYAYLSRIFHKTKDNYLWQSTFQATIFWMTMFLLLGVVVILRWQLHSFEQDKQRLRLTGHLYDGLLYFLQQNLYHLALIAVLFVTFFATNLPYANYRLLINALFVWLIFRSMIWLARLYLLEGTQDVSGRDVKLYYRLKWLLIFGGWSTGVMVFSLQLPLSTLLQDISVRLFMMFLLLVSIAIWKSRDVLHFSFRSFLKTKKRYVRNAINLVFWLVPLTLFTTAGIGLVGYINMAWTLSRYEVYVLMVIVGYVLARGLMFDLLELISEWMITNLQNGWLWIEVILKPADRILRAVILILSILLLFELFGWYSDGLLTDKLDKLLAYQLIDVSGVHITFLSTVQFLILLFIFLWMAKWTREFCYRWLYRNTKDPGIRNSLSVFTQYAVILIGTFITLRVLGLDFTGMSMVLGGLAVGMGFGLRDFASNIIGGVMLLIERPVREGDLITLGEYEGRVAHIGIRSMRVSSWDNMEVLIPNAETFNKPFTNWTHQDGIVRTVIPVKVSRSDDPLMVQQLILDVLAIVPEILTEPAPQVLLKQIDEALIELEVRYFINVQLHSRFEIRSKVLFAITAQFNAAGVKAPIPPLSVELKETQTSV